MIHICMCFQDKTGLYSKFAAATMCSIFENLSTPPQAICIHILHDNTLTIDNRDKFIYLADRYGQLVKFYNVEKICAGELQNIKNFFPDANKTRFSIGMFYRFFIPQVLPKDIEKAVYLDADIIVHRNIAELWNVELGDKPLAAVPAILNWRYINNPLVTDGLVKSEDYFNSGVLLMNLNVLRSEKEKLVSGIKFIGESHGYGGLPDQNILNYCFASRSRKLPVDFNQYVYFARKQKQSPARKIYHYAGRNIRWSFSLNMNDSFNRLWMSYFMRTPWFAVDVIGRIYMELLRVRSVHQDRAISVSASLSGKTRAFFVDPAKIDSLKKIFSISGDELIIPAKDETSLQNLIDAMKSSKGKALFFIMTKKFLKKKFPFDLLKDNGFVEAKDFVKGWAFLSEEKGGDAYNSHPLIQKL